ncbi:MAG: OadG family protein [Planctomycetota bacterium]|jgi:sodium pump decarboxylase gamma subunit|nr:OadG family protein [Planctomycetota bacterium]
MTNPLSNISLGVVDSFGISLLGFAIVFMVLIVLLVVIRILRSAVESFEASKAAPAAAAAVPAPAAALTAAKDPNMVPAKGSLGDIKLHDVDDKTAALLMAIVADEMQAPLNELRFLSIREKK